LAPSNRTTVFAFLPGAIRILFDRSVFVGHLWFLELDDRSVLLLVVVGQKKWSQKSTLVEMEREQLERG